MNTAWAQLDPHAARLKATNLRTLFANDSERFAKFSVRLGDLLIDFSKEKIDAPTLDALFNLARAGKVEAARDAMFTGEHWNLTEDRAVLHMALRGGATAPAGEDVEITLSQFLDFAEDVRSGRYKAKAGRFTDVINIGIGGSDLGPVMVTRALEPDRDGPRLHFVSNVDSAHLTDITKSLDPTRTLVIIASKTFTTMETMMNARSARAWLKAGVGEDAGHHMAAVSTNIEGPAEFGIKESRVFGFWDWVGGRYSIWSAIGLPVAIGIGADNFRAFLSGATAMDQHFREAPLEKNLPVILALLGIWRRNAMGWPTVALIPYDQRLERFPAYVQQLDMESNGKRTARDGAPVSTSTGPIIWGESGTNAQHSFFQLLHQGTDTIPVDFIAAAESRDGASDHHTALLGNCLAQGQALAFGRTEAEVREAMAKKSASHEDIEKLATHRVFPGDRPSITILHRTLDPYTLGRLIALFEHKIFVQGVIWDVNSFDQWGVELGKELAVNLIPSLSNDTDPDLDVSTIGLISTIKELST